MKIRDLTIVPLPAEQCLVTAVDISAAIGEKQYDVLNVPPELTGKLTARVALLEVLASGAEVVAVNDVVGAEMEPTGKRVIRGIQEELELAGLAHLELNGSTEENMSTSQTSVGILVTGFALLPQLKVNNVQTDAVLFGFGEPRMGKAVLEKPVLEVSYELVRNLVKRNEVLELVPVGSKGILYESSNLAQLNGCRFSEEADCDRNWLNKSAGPATVLLVAVCMKEAEQFKQAFPDAYKIGRLAKKEAV